MTLRGPPLPLAPPAPAPMASAVALLQAVAVRATAISTGTAHAWLRILVLRFARSLVPEPDGFLCDTQIHRAGPAAPRSRNRPVRTFPRPRSRCSGAPFDYGERP